ncbi:MAG: hypothetical protein U0984_07385 [Prosthecobacter sp.]|nr:hypothetical protein [Prosthecobacter sp.]
MSSPIYLGTRKGLFTLERDASGWRIANSAFLGVQIPMLLPDPRDGTLFAAVEHGHFGSKLHASTDGGATWEERVCPAYPPKPEGVPDTINMMNQKVMPWSLEKIWSLEAGGPNEPGVLWCGTIPGGLFKSTDSGLSWTMIDSLWNRPERAQWFGGGYDWPGIHSIWVEPANPRRILIAVSCGGVWESLDAGETWTQHGQGLIADYLPPELAGGLESQDPHRMVVCPAAPQRAWIQHHNGIFRSDDAGHTWERLFVSPSAFGFAVAVHPRDPDTAWFVPGVKDEERYPPGGAMCVTRTRDGGKTFEACRNGLPQEHAYHLVYRHCLDVAADGQTLVMGSTTGSVWISENGGDQWQRVSAELPPIYCARFG